MLLFQGVTTVGDLKINQLGHDKEILEKLQQDPNLTKTNGNGIRDNFSYLKSQPQTQGVNRVLFRAENEEGEEQNNEEVWKKDRSDSADSDDGLNFESDPLTHSPLGKPLPTLEETPVSKMNQLVNKTIILNSFIHSNKYVKHTKIFCNNFCFS